MKWSVMLFLAVLFLAALPACNESPSDLPTLTVTRPSGGEVFELGTPVTVSWTCAGCEAILGTRSVAVYASGPTASPVRTVRVPIGLGGPTDSFVWTAGKPLGGGLPLDPGTYRLFLQTLPADAESITDTSREFQLVVTIR